MNCLALLLSFSMHLGGNGDYNNIHPHLRCEKDSLIVGTYYNSEKDISYYFGKNYNFNDWELDLALVSGYRDRGIQPMIRLKSNGWYISPMYGNYYFDSNRAEVRCNNCSGKPQGNYGFVIGYEIQIR